ncbi:response regulator [Atlantibacter sp.]|uniref:response regulator n=1 Tax=Atlantibacter sp. TaxID=1903473 RepID=UPI0028A67398|nr:transporter substrate-binding domain-containing protein [Atlantibacter sp.]
MKSLLIILFVLLSALLTPARAQTPGAEKLDLSGFNPLQPVQLYLTDEQNRWLRQKKTLRVAIFPPDIPPLVLNTVSGRYRGMNADYLALMQRSLNTNLEVWRYQNEAQAMAALKQNNVDLLLTGLQYQPEPPVDVVLSAPVIASWPALVTTLSNVMEPLRSEKSVTVATVGDYPPPAWIKQSFPNAQIHHYASYHAALSSVAEGKNSYFIGDSLPGSAIISQEFALALTTVKYWGDEQKRSHFLIAPSQELLRQIVNSFLGSIDEHLHNQITQSWIEKGNLTFALDKLELTNRERQWLSQHKTLRIIVNPYFAPYTLLDSNLETRGIIGDILNLISLQTGLKFETIVAKSNDEMLEAMGKGNWHLMQTATWDVNRINNLSYTHPFITTPNVIVMKNGQPQAIALRSGMTVAIASLHNLIPVLNSKYPGIAWRQVDNASVALNLVANGDVDAAISNQLTARYFSEHYYPDQLAFTPLPDEPPSAIGFAMPRSEPELRQILDKALDNIPQKEILQIVGKWVRLPDVTIDTWELYNKPFYLVAVLAGLLVLSSLIWGLYLLSEIRKRKRAQYQMEQEKDNALRANKEKRVFLARMSHEIRTPVSAIMGFLELLHRSREIRAEHDKTAVDRAWQAAQSLMMLIGNVLDLEKIESGKVELTPRWVDINALLAEVVQLFSGLAAQKSLQLRVNSSLEDVRLWLDPQPLRQALTNLVGNAVKFTALGSVTVAAQTQRVDDKQVELIINVSDTGPGISAEQQSRLFTPFSQTDAGRAQTGSGLGLAISKELLAQMGGTLALQSEPGQGATFTLALTAASQRSRGQRATETPTQPDALSPHLAILIADDHSTNRLLLKEQLHALGQRADEASDGLQALKALKQRQYDLLITDINMPEMDGIALAQALRAAGQNLVIWGLTASAQEEEQQRCLAAGMNACLFKPLNLSQLHAMLSTLALPEKPVLDVEKLSRLTMNNKALMLNALEDAQRENRRDLLAAKAAAVQGDWVAVRHHLHRLNGTAQLLGAVRLHDLAARLEQDLVDNKNSHGMVANLLHMDALLDELDNEAQLINSDNN